jgi:TIR domain
MPNVFLSYAREDREQAGRIAGQLVPEGVTVWRDEQQLRVGQTWPKALGEAIAASDAVLLLRSKRAEGSVFVELEWSTALALKKTILPCLLDQTPLPSILAAIETTEPAKLAAAVRKSRVFHSAETNVRDEPHTKRVLGQLGEIEAGTPAEVLSKAKAIFAQSNWSVQGPVYQAGGDIHIGTPPTPKTKLERSQAWVAILVGILAAVTLGAALVRNYLPSPKREETPASQNAAASVQSLSGTISDDAGEPLANVQVSVFLAGKVVANAMTGSVGQFSFQIDGPREADVALVSQKGGYTRKKDILI